MTIFLLLPHRRKQDCTLLVDVKLLHDLLCITISRILGSWRLPSGTAEEQNMVMGWRSLVSNASIHIEPVLPFHRSVSGIVIYCTEGCRLPARLFTFLRTWGQSPAGERICHPTSLMPWVRMVPPKQGDLRCLHRVWDAKLLFDFVASFQISFPTYLKIRRFLQALQVFLMKVYMRKGGLFHVEFWC